ncbi:unnamed protein product, partial [Didymodactylos carnosus]
MACIDRYLRSSSKVNYRNLATAKTATRYVIPTVIAVSCLLYIHILFFFEIQFGQCQAAGGWYSKFFQFWYLLFYTLLPPTLMIIFGLLTLNNVKKQRQRLAAAPRARAITVPTITIFLASPSIGTAGSAAQQQRRQRRESTMRKLILIQVFT